jgi:hypothetical protein
VGELAVPTASQNVALGQVTPDRSPTLDQVREVPGVPLVTGTARPRCDVLSPTASQAVALWQAMPLRDVVDGTTTGAPGLPLVMDTATPLPFESFPTASHIEGP